MNHLASSLPSRTVLGILGSGQLARMTAIAASEFGIQTKIYCSESEMSPAEHVASKTIKGTFADLESILNFCEGCDFITLENEFIDQHILEAIDLKYPDRLFPNSKTFKLIGDKISEKKSFKKAGLKVAPFIKVETKEDLYKFAETHGYPVVLKSSKGGYDGHGNVTIKNKNEVDEKFYKLKGELLVEAFIPYEKELAVIVARNQRDEMVVYPVAHTIQENHICHYVCVPADISPQIENEIKENAKLAMTAIDAVGIFAFEFFLTKNGELYLNESAPRPHNSGHYSIEGCVTSQFDNHVRSVLNLPLGKTTLRTPYVLMLNLLGTQNAPACLENADQFLGVQDGHLHLYGKKHSKVGRKMGHFTLLGEDINRMFTILENLKSEYSL
ncbi:MAG: 5-(carboxyamino)imidazole ribonucleotide synthase [Bacteriovorax sp.]